MCSPEFVNVLCSSRSGILESLDDDCPGSKKSPCNVNQKMSPTSQRYQWIKPAKRSVEATDPVEDISFQKVSSEKGSQPSHAAGPRSAAKRVCKTKHESSHEEAFDKLYSSLLSIGQSKDKMVLLRYLKDDMLSPDSAGEETPEVPSNLSLCFDNLQASPIQFPTSVRETLQYIDQDSLPPSAVQIGQWSRLFIDCFRKR